MTLLWPLLSSTANAQGQAPVAIQVQVPPATLVSPLAAGPEIRAGERAPSGIVDTRAKTGAPAVSSQQSKKAAIRIVKREPSAPRQGVDASLPEDVAMPEGLRHEPASSAVKETTPRQRADALYGRALQQLQEARGSEARQTLMDALQDMPRHDEARLLLATLLIEERQLARAESLLSDALPGLPGPAVVSALARLKVERGEDGAALSLLLSFELSAQSDAPYQAFLGALLIRARRPDEAVLRYQKALQLSPGPGAWWAGLGLAASQQPGQAVASLGALRRALGAGGLSPELRDRVERQVALLERSEAPR